MGAGPFTSNPAANPASSPAGGTLSLTFSAKPDSPLVNPALVIEGWGRAPARLTLDGRTLEPEVDFKLGYRQTLAGEDLIVWLPHESTSAANLQIEAR